MVERGKTLAEPTRLGKGPMKTIENHFTDWEQSVFGYGYGSGEKYIAEALKKFFELCPDSGNYDYEVFEKSLGQTVTWLLINTLCRADILEYGTSPRFGWLDDKGRELKKFFDSKTIDELENLSGHQEDYNACFQDFCNCNDPSVCHNPFWNESKDRKSFKD